MPIQTINKMRETGYVSKGPNEDPKKHFILVENLKKTQSSIGTGFDVSGSQQTQGGRDLVRYMKFCNGKDIKSSIFPFGDDGVMDSFPSIEKFNEIYYRVEKFTSGTLTYSLNDFLEKTKERGINKVVIIGDGDFGNYCIDRKQETRKFIDKLKNLDLSHIQSLKLVFSPHTNDHIMTTLKDSVFNILSSSKNALDVSYIRLPKYDMVATDHMYNIYKEMSMCIDIPSGYSLVGNLFTFNTKMTDRNLAKVILEEYEDIIKPLEKYMKFIIENQPDLLLVEDNIYSKLHNVLKMILKYSYINWISLEKSKATGKKLEALTELLNNSYNKDAEVEELYKKLEPYVIGYGIFPDTQITPKQILEMLKDGSCIMLKNFLSNILKSDRLIYEPRGKKSLEENKGMLIVRPRKSSDGEEYTEILRLSLKTLMYQFGNYLLEGNRTYITGLSLLVNEENTEYGDKKIPPLIKRTVCDAIFGDKSYTFRMLGFDPKSETLELADNLCSPPIMRLVATSVINFPKRMFVTIGKQEKELKYIMSKFLRLQNIIKTYKTKLKDYKIKRQIKVKLGGINVGDIAFVDHYESEPQINLSAVVVIREMRKSKKKKKWVCDGEYLDRDMNLRKKDIRFGIPLNKVQVVCSVSDRDLIKKLNIHLMKQQKEGEKGIYTGTYKIFKEELGGKMRLDGIYDKEFRDYNDSEVKDIIKKHLVELSKTNDTDYKIEDIDVPVPKEHILDILQYSFKLNDKLKELLNSEARLNKNDILECSEIMYKIDEKDLVLKPIVYADNDFTITKADIDSVKEIFKLNLEEYRVTLSSISSFKYCPICIEEKPINEFTMFEECNHPICLECKGYYDEQIKYEAGSLVQMRFHKCCECNHIQKSGIPLEVKNVLDKYGGELPSKIKLKYCVECYDLFETELHCGMSDEEIPDLCEECRPKLDDKIKICPQCGEGIFRDEGCDHMACVCGAHWCWGCQRIFSDEINELLDGINWICDEDCDDSSEVKYLDNPDDYIGY
jgi:hypothetical protein